MEPDRWLGVEVRHLAALEAVAREGSFGRAAEHLGYTQSAISQQIATLERIVGAKLLERPGGPRRGSLTEAGELLLRHAEAVVARLRAAEADIASLLAGEGGALRVGTYQSVGAKILPTLMRRFRESWPHVEIQLTEDASDEGLLKLVERGELDVSFAMLPVSDGPFEAVELLRDPYVVLVAADSPLACKQSVRVDDLEGVHLIGNRVCRTTALAESALRMRGVAAEVTFRSDDNGTVQGLVAAGVGAALVPLLAGEARSARGAGLGTAPPIPPRVIQMVWHRDRYRSPAAEAFVEVAQQVCAELAGAAERPAA